jgi:hypothetical protein
MVQAVQIAGAQLILSGFVLAQFDVLDQRSYAYLIPNLVGSVTLTVTGVLSRDWGFVFLEGVWAIVSAVGMGQRLRGAEPMAEG